VRRNFKIVDGQKFYLVPFGDGLIMKPVSDDPSEKLSKMLGDFQFSKKDRRKAESWLLRETTRKKKPSS